MVVLDDDVSDAVASLRCGSPVESEVVDDGKDEGIDACEGEMLDVVTEERERHGFNHGGSQRDHVWVSPALGMPADDGADDGGVATSDMVRIRGAF